MLQPTRVLALPHKGHATSAKPAEMSGKAAEGGGGQIWHVAPLADDREQLQQQTIPPEHPRLLSRAISW